MLVCASVNPHALAPVFWDVKKVVCIFAFAPGRTQDAGRNGMRPAVFADPGEAAGM